MPYTIPRKKKPHTNLPTKKYSALRDEIDYDKIETYRIKKHNNIIIGIAVGVMITACAVIYVVASFIENVI